MHIFKTIKWNDFAYTNIHSHTNVLRAVIVFIAIHPAFMCLLLRLSRCVLSFMNSQRDRNDDIAKVVYLHMKNATT